MKYVATIGLLLFSLALLAQKATIVTSPSPIPDDGRIKVFLAGSIDMGKSENWQAITENEFSSFDIIVLNPRRSDWNLEWKPVKSDSNFARQVEWELDALEKSDIILMYFAPGSQSPITLLELGLYAPSGKLMVACPEGFWRKGNVDIVCEHYGIPIFETLDGLKDVLKKRLPKFE